MFYVLCGFYRVAIVYGYDVVMCFFLVPLEVHVILCSPRVRIMVIIGINWFTVSASLLMLYDVLKFERFITP